MRRIQVFINKDKEHMQIKARKGILRKYAEIDLHNPRSDEDKRIINDMALQDIVMYDAAIEKHRTCGHSPSQ